MCANGARSPLAPTDPCLGITGKISWFNKSLTRLTNSNRTPLTPLAHVNNFKNKINLVIPSSNDFPTPVACDLTKLSCNF